MTITVEIKDEAVATLLEMARSEQSDTTAIVVRLVNDGINQFATARNVAPEDADDDWDRYPPIHDIEAVKEMFARDTEFDKEWWAGLSETQRARHMEEIERSSASRVRYTAEEVMERVRAKFKGFAPR